MTLKTFAARTAVFAAVTSAGFSVVHAQQQQARPQSSASTNSGPVPKLEGAWVRLDTTGSGRWDELTSKFTPASLTPEGQQMLTRGGRGRGGPGAPGGAAGGRGAQQPQDTQPHAAGQPYVVRPNPCAFAGGFAGQVLETDSVAFHLVQSKDEIMMVRDGVGARHIFMDGRKIPDPSFWDPSALGVSVGRYENGALVVETSDLSAGPVTAGGYRTPETLLVQRFTLSPDGKHLTVSYEYRDPKIYAKPHTYQYTFERLPEDAPPLEDFCDASDPKQGWSIVPPEQR